MENITDNELNKELDLPKSEFKTIKHKLHSENSFLNLPFTYHTGSLHTYVILEEKEKYAYLEATFKLRDCYKTVDLTFDFEEKEDEENAIFKIDTIIKQATKFKEDLLKGIELKNKLMEEKKNAK